jgi:hypothetical protein
VLDPDGKLSSRSLADHEDPVAAILAMMPRAAPRAGVVRIVFHPASIEMREVSCANAGRSRLHRLLSREFPVLKAAGTLWAMDSIRPDGGGHGTMLYIDVHSLLPRLVDGLARLGIRTEGAWPLQSLVEAAAPAAVCRESSCAVVAIAGHALVSSWNSAGVRSVHHHDGGGFAEDALTDLGTALALLEGDGALPGLCALENVAGTALLRNRLGDPGAAATSIAAFLERARFLRAAGISNFLPRRYMGAAKRVLAGLAAALGLAMMAGAAWFAHATWQYRNRTLRSEGEAGEHRLQMRAAIESRLVAQDEIRRLEQALAQLQTPPQREYALLTAISRLIPNEVEVLDISTRGEDFSILGRCEGNPAGPRAVLAKFRQDLESEGSPWSLAAEPAAGTGPEFSWHGSFRRDTHDDAP